MTSRSVSMADPVKVPVNVAVTLKMIIVFGPAWIGGPAKLKQGLKLPLTGPGVPASALGNVNVAPAIASAQKHLRKCDKRRFRLNQQFVFIYISKRTGRQSSGQSLELAKRQSTSCHQRLFGDRSLSL